MTPAAAVVASGGLQFGQDVFAGDVVPVGPARVLPHGVDQVIDLVGRPEGKPGVSRRPGELEPEVIGGRQLHAILASLSIPSPKKIIQAAPAGTARDPASA